MAITCLKCSAKIDKKKEKDWYRFYKLTKSNNKRTAGYFCDLICVMDYISNPFQQMMLSNSETYRIEDAEGNVQTIEEFYEWVRKEVVQEV